ncbi:ExbD/TolR family protein [Herbaspirillum huttiense]|uniref:Biopolymer transporter ExbD n=4 Tax=Pseudomonadota TaxID=1224 RepID=A0AAJ2LR40_9BURK|nr:MULTISPECIES: biopolymer transporter ExbD [Herbaspirillum]MAF06033.1 biopolymer transporter ExbD [Herbaspirillum sp.]MBN9354860.1 biopolymer transporter ExbD [Herbaspirillum huttiense]MBO15063.1 biopolymer transporter ExbD [Herbaspirillum sp.]MBP1314629.1 biopolymer transport protein ExbD [Herbaspirillum sp. 1130]MCO4858595.1 biopolymer transporter ExbD [Herbaspirillum sp. WGmk3]|tara:strand:+ start:2029 stop:2436 length:408 start_codon:yes stop_codon:yes gene_type:complete
MRSWDEPKKRKARVEIIPMIDVMMFLLVFFVLISLNVIPALGLKTQLPSSSTAQDLKPQTKAVITIAKEDVIQVDGENTTLDALTARLDKLRKDGEKLNLIINSDRGVEVQRLVDVMDTLKKGGFDSISIATRKQ